MTIRRATICCSLVVFSFAFPAWAQQEDVVAGQAQTAEEAPAEQQPQAPPAPSDTMLQTSTSDIAPAGATLGQGKHDPKAGWDDIVVVPRKAVLKSGRVEIVPFTGTTLNDNLIQHFSVGGELNYFLSDVLSVGLSGMYYFKNVLDEEFYTRYHFERIPSLNKYRYTGALSFGYVPIYGKYALLNKQIMHYDFFFTAGVGISGSEIIPRDYKYSSFKNDYLLTFPVGIGSRIYFNKWIGLYFVFRDYMLLDKFEPINRQARGLGDAEKAKAAAETRFINNIMLNVGVSFYFPMDFKYSSSR